MSKRIGIAIVLALLLVGLWSCRAPIALRVMERGLARNMAGDPIGELPPHLQRGRFRVERERARRAEFDVDRRLAG